MHLAVRVTENIQGEYYWKPLTAYGKNRKMEFVDYNKVFGKEA